MPNSWTGAQSDTRQRVFISYSHDPPENARFVRDLAGRLRSAGFEVWLDEEKVPGAANIKQELRKAIQESEIGLFIATARWLRREWTQFEVTLFGMREESRRLVVLREDIDLGDLGPHLINLKNVAWPPGDADRDARFWEIYCGITGRPPGPREFWEREGRRVASSHGGAAAAEAAAPAPEPAAELLRPGGRTPLPCTGRPVGAVAGDRWTFLATDHEEWVGVGAGGELHPVLPRLSDHATAAFGPGGELLVGLYEPMLARLRGGRWEYLPQEASVLSLADAPGGYVAGTAAGGLVRVDDSPPAPFARIRDPVAALASFEGGLIVLGSRGIFGRVLWPVAGEDALEWINTGALGRPLGLFGAVEYNRVGVYSATRLGVLDPLTERLAVCEKAVAQGVRDVVFLGARSRPYAVLTEAGGLLLVDAGLRDVRPVRLPGEAYVVGCCAAAHSGGLHAWTQDGQLYTVSEAAVESVAADGVVLAYPPSLSTAALHVVRWRPGAGATLEWMTTD